MTQVHSLSQNSEITQGFFLFPVLALNPSFLLLTNTLPSYALSLLKDFYFETGFTSSQADLEPIILSQ